MPYTYTEEGSQLPTSRPIKGSFDWTDYELGVRAT